MVLQLASTLLTGTKSFIGKMQCRMGGHLKLVFAGIILAPMLLCGCSHFNEGTQAKATFKEANDLFSQGNFEASLGKYQQIIEKYPVAGDRVLFEMGIIYAYPRNEQRDYQRSLASFQKLVKAYPESQYRKESELMIFNINNVILKDKTIAAQQAHIETLRQEAKNRGDESFFNDDFGFDFFVVCEE